LDLRFKPAEGQTKQPGGSRAAAIVSIVSTPLTLARQQSDSFRLVCPLSLPYACKKKQMSIRHLMFRLLREGRALSQREDRCIRGT
jgi:hypothetical protein